MELWDHQRKALDELRNGSVLVGSTGSGKSLTALSYYVKVRGEDSLDLYIITTAKKRNEGDWIKEAKKLGISELVVDSWNNIKKYVGVSNAFFVFDEQRVVGSGAWVKSFLKITKKNQWVLLSATPADTWMDLIPVFVANGYYKNRTAFIREHVIYAPYVTFPKIIGYQYVPKLKELRDKLFVLMLIERHTKSHVKRIKVQYNKELVKKTLKTQWNPFTDKPIENFPQEVSVCRQIINSHVSRILKLVEIQKEVKRLIIFYNFNFELEIMRQWFQPITVIKEHNGYRHDRLPEGPSWVYLVQYQSGSEAWECFTTNHTAFYSLHYSHRRIKQARGRTNRYNTDYNDLYYYELVSDSFLDRAITKAYAEKKDFNIKMLNRRKLHAVL
jgi:hypothetical protein